MVVALHPVTSADQITNQPIRSTISPIGSIGAEPRPKAAFRMD